MSFMNCPMVGPLTDLNWDIKDVKTYYEINEATGKV